MAEGLEVTKIRLVLSSIGGGGSPGRPCRVTHVHDSATFLLKPVKKNLTQVHGAVKIRHKIYYL